MIRYLLLSLCLVGMAACGGGGAKSDLVKACVEQGDSKKSCACMADKLKEAVSPQAFEAIVSSARGDEEAAKAAMKELGMAETMEIGVVMMTAGAECNATGFGR